MRTLLIDNHDSYTYNLFQLFAEVTGTVPVVIRNDDHGGCWDDAAKHLLAAHGRCKEREAGRRGIGAAFDCIVVSPGPGHPSRPADFGLCTGAIKSGIPVLGVCLGHQGIAHVFGGDVVRAPRVMHGRLSACATKRTSRPPSQWPAATSTAPSIFAGVPEPFEVVRYHSLVVQAATLPACLEPTAWTLPGGGADTSDAAVDGMPLIMALRHRELPIYGVQFHPESIGTRCGHALVENFCNAAATWWATALGSPCTTPRNAVASPPCSPSVVAPGIAHPLPRRGAAAASLAASAGPVVHALLARLARCELVVRQLPLTVTESCACAPVAANAALPSVPAAAFARLFGRSRTSFWLDSATCDNAERVAFPEPAVPGTAAAAAATSTGSGWDDYLRVTRGARWSYMGDATGPLSVLLHTKNADIGVQTASHGDDHGVVLTRRLHGAPDISETQACGNEWTSMALLKCCLRTLRSTPVRVVGAEGASSTLPPFRCGFVGFCGYECVGPHPHLVHGKDDSTVPASTCASSAPTTEGVQSVCDVAASAVAASNRCVPDAAWLLADRVLAFDHRTGRVWTVTLRECDSTRSPLSSSTPAVVKDGGGGVTAATCGGLHDRHDGWSEEVLVELRDINSRRRGPSKATPTAAGQRSPFSSAADEKEQGGGDTEGGHGDRRSTLRFVPNRSKARYTKDIAHCLDQMRRGETYEVCLTNQLYTPRLPLPPSAQCRQLSTEGMRRRDDGRARVRADERVTPEDGGKDGPLHLYDTLRRTNPAPYAAFLRFDPHGWLNDACKAQARAVKGGDSGAEEGASGKEAAESDAHGRVGGPACCICCSSPERFLRLRPESEGVMEVESKPIKGTRKRGHDAAWGGPVDAAIAAELEACVKDRAENLMIVDLVRNDISRICNVGSIRVPHLMAVESFSSVHQLVSTVRGTLRPEADVVDVLDCAFPGGSMTGAPKERTMAIIAALEDTQSMTSTIPEGREKRTNRGVYSGCLGFISVDGAADLNIVIRTAVLTPHGCTVGTGGAIVALSDPEEEYEEMLLKARKVCAAIATTLPDVHGFRTDSAVS